MAVVALASRRNCGVGICNLFAALRHSSDARAAALPERALEAVL
jgi:hypothetical protein